MHISLTMTVAAALFMGIAPDAWISPGDRAEYIQASESPATQPTAKKGVSDDSSAFETLAPDTTASPGRPTSEQSLLRGFNRAEHFHVRDLNADLVARCLEVAEDIDPRLAQRLEALRQKQPDRFKVHMRRVGRRLVSLAELRRRDPDLYDLKIFVLHTEAEARRIAQMIRKDHKAGKTDRVEELEFRLHTQLSLLTAYSLKTREDYLCRLQEHVQDLEVNLARDRARMEELVNARMRRMLKGNEKPTPEEKLSSGERDLPSSSPAIPLSSPRGEGEKLDRPARERPHPDPPG